MAGAAYDLTRITVVREHFWQIRTINYMTELSLNINAYPALMTQSPKTTI